MDERIALKILELLVFFYIAFSLGRRYEKR